MQYNEFASDTAAKSLGTPEHTDTELNMSRSASQDFSFWPQPPSMPVPISAQPADDPPGSDGAEVTLCQIDCRLKACVSCCDVTA